MFQINLECYLKGHNNWLVIRGIGFGLFSSPNTNAIMGSVERRFYGVASAMVSTMSLLGQTLSMGLALMVFAIFVGNVTITLSSTLHFQAVSKQFS
jgi:hypothetical protein